MRLTVTAALTALNTEGIDSMSNKQNIAEKYISKSG